MSWQSKLGFFIGGLTAGLFVREIKSLKFLTDFDVFDILTLLFSGLVALILGRLATDVRAQKDILMDFIKDVREVASDVRKKFIEAFHSGTATPQTDRAIVDRCRDLSIALSTVESVLKECSAGSTAMRKLETATDSFFRYKAELTKNAFSQRTYQQADYTREEALFLELQKNLFSLMITINKAWS